MSQAALQRRGKLETRLDNKYHDTLVEFQDVKGDLHYGRVQTIGIEWNGGFAYTVTLNLDDKRHQLDYDTFIKTTKIL